MKKQITARIPEELYYKCNLENVNITDTVVAALELFSNQDEVNCNANCNANVNTISELNTQIEEKEKTIKELQDQLKVKDDQIKVSDGSQNNRIEDLKNHIYLLDNQLRTKDDQIEKLNENMHKQSVHIQTLINQKAIEAPGSKRPWWKIW
jgi:predicted RNase H-like nuclease (RuvC/YqgF family)